MATNVLIAVCQYAGADDGSRIDTAVLAAVGNDIYRNELQG